MFQTLLESPGWGQLAEVAASQMETRKGYILGPAEDANTQLKTEFMKGELAGIDIMMRLPGLIVEQSQITLSEMEGEG